MSHTTDGASPETTLLDAEAGLPPELLAALQRTEAAGTRRGRGSPRSLARRLGLVTSVLVLGLVAALGFLVGVRVQKGEQTTVTAAAGGGAAAFAALAGGGGFPGAGGAGGAGIPGGAGRPGGAAAGAAATGTVKLVDGANIYVTDASGNVVKVTTSDASRFTKSSPGTIADVRPGDTVTVQGQKGDDGTVAATAVTNTGAGR